MRKDHRISYCIPAERGLNLSVLSVYAMMTRQLLWPQSFPFLLLFWCSLSEVHFVRHKRCSLSDMIEKCRARNLPAEGNKLVDTCERSLLVCFCRVHACQAQHGYILGCFVMGGRLVVQGQHGPLDLAAKGLTHLHVLVLLKPQLPSGSTWHVQDVQAVIPCSTCSDAYLMALVAVMKTGLVALCCRLSEVGHAFGGAGIVVAPTFQAPTSHHA